MNATTLVGISTLVLLAILQQPPAPPQQDGIAKGRPQEPAPAIKRGDLDRVTSLGPNAEAGVAPVFATAELAKNFIVRPPAPSGAGRAGSLEGQVCVGHNTPATVDRLESFSLAGHEVWLVQITIGSGLLKGQHLWISARLLRDARRTDPAQCHSQRRHHTRAVAGNRSLLPDGGRIEMNRASSISAALAAFSLAVAFWPPLLFGESPRDDADLAILRKLDPSLETSEVKTLRDVRELDLTSTPVTDAEMSAVAKAINLENLVLTRTSISNSGLRRISDLKRLKYIDLIDTCVTDEGLLSLPVLNKLVTLQVDGTDVGDRGLSWLGSCTSLRMLSLKRTGIRDRDLAKLGQCTELQMLAVDDTRVTGSFFEYCGKLPNLWSITASRNKRLSAANFPRTKGLPELTFLDFSQTDVGDDCTAFLKTLPRLNSLFLRETKVTDGAMSGIAKIRMLEFVDLGDTMVTDKGVDLLQNMERLNHIDLSGTFVTAECIKNLRKRFENLRCVYAYPPKRPEA